MQEGNKEAEALREKAQAAAAEAVNLRHALHTSTARLKVRSHECPPHVSIF